MKFRMCKKTAETRDMSAMFSSKYKLYCTHTLNKIPRCSTSIKLCHSTIVKLLIM